MMLSFLRKLLGGTAAEPVSRFGLDELSRRLGLCVDALRAVRVEYHRFEIPKRRGGMRTILAPAAELKAVQRTILRRLLRRLKAHPCATGFEQGHSIVTNAMPHVGKAVVIKLDVKDFFPSTTAARIKTYFRAIGWDAETAELLTQLCTHDGALPQGAPTSPRLSNLVNFRLDARLAGHAAARGVSYSRYADDITFSGPGSPTLVNRKTSRSVSIPATRVNDLIHVAKWVLEDEGYQLHTDKKLRIARAHDRQSVTGIVVNQKANLPRSTRRRLRAIEHRLRTKGQATLTAQQLQGWRSLQQMVATQAAGG